MKLLLMLINWIYSNKPRNVILFIADGMAVTVPTIARDMLNVRNNSVTSETTLALDTILSGSCTTKSLNYLVTDSAAGATAFATGVRTFNGWVSNTLTDLSKAVYDYGVNEKYVHNGYAHVNVTDQDDVIRLKTVLEGAQEKGLWTGIVSSTRVTHATPAAFTTHVVNRGR